MYVSYKQREIVDSQKVEIYGENDPYFWYHKGRKPEEKENLRKFAKLLPDALYKRNKGIELSEDEKYSYNIFITNGPTLSYDDVRDVYTVTDGRHRMYMLREEGINIEAEVEHFVSFRPKTINEVFYEEDKMAPVEIQEEKIEKKSIPFFEIFKKILHINNEEQVSSRIEEQHSNIIDKLAIVDSEINKRFLYELGIEVCDSYDGYVVVTNENANLENLIKKFSSNEVLVSTENIRHQER